VLRRSDIDRQPLQGCGRGGRCAVAAKNRKRGVAWQPCCTRRLLARKTREQGWRWLSRRDRARARGGGNELRTCGGPTTWHCKSLGLKTRGNVLSIKLADSGWEVRGTGGWRRTTARRMGRRTRHAKRNKTRASRVRQARGSSEEEERWREKGAGKGDKREAGGRKVETGQRRAAPPELWNWRLNPIGAAPARPTTVKGVCARALLQHID